MNILSLLRAFSPDQDPSLPSELSEAREQIVSGMFWTKWVIGLVASGFGFVVGSCLALYSLVQWMRGGLDSAGAIRLAAPALIALTTGAAMLWASHRSYQQEKSFRRRVRQHPDAPWAWREDWARGVIQSDVVAWPWVAGAFVFGMVFVALGVTVIAGRSASGSGHWVAGSVFSGAGLGVVVLGVYLFRRRRKYGRSSLHLESVPIALGGVLRGEVTAPYRFDSVDMEATLREVFRTIEQVTDRDGDREERSRDSTLWRSEASVPHRELRVNGCTTVIPLSFRLPLNHRQTTPVAPHRKLSRIGVYWALEVRAKVSGIDYSADFEVPVFGQVEGSEEAAALSAFPVDIAQGSSVTATDAVSGATASRTTVRSRDGNIEMFFPAARNRGAAWMWTIGSVVFGGGFYLGWSRLDVPYWLAWMLGIVSALSACVALKVWTQTTTLIFGAQELNIHRQMFGRRRAVCIPRCDISNIESQVSGQFGQTFEYRIVVATHERRGMILVESLRNKRDVDVLVAQMRALLGLRRAPSEPPKESASGPPYGPRSVNERRE